MCERLPEERREDGKEKQLMMIKAGYLWVSVNVLNIV